MDIEMMDFYGFLAVALTVSVAAGVVVFWRFLKEVTDEMKDDE